MLSEPARLDFWADVKALPAISTTVPVPEQPGRDDSPGGGFPIPSSQGGTIPRQLQKRRLAFLRRFPFLIGQGGTIPPAAFPVPERASRDGSRAAAKTLHGTPAAVCYTARAGGSPVSCKSAPSPSAGGEGRGGSGRLRLFCLRGACAKRLAILLAIGYNKKRKTKKAAAARVMYPHPERPAYGSPTCRTQRHISRTAQSLYLFPSLFSRGRGALPHVPFRRVLPKTRWGNVPNRKHLKSSYERPTWA
ncbi:hypothetical protein D7X33_10705 [Butyricicoccus sp. 1XD8-22]|nr:hypothetical protein D7X33_10705 [Butyricicoccus sp. 1XD8-22]